MLRLGPGRHGCEADILGNLGFGRVHQWRGEPDAVEPHGDIALAEAGLALVPVEADAAWRRGFAHQLGIKLGRPDRIGGVHQQGLAIGRQGFLAEAEQNLGEHRQIGVLLSARDKAIGALGFIGERAGRHQHFVHGLGEGEALLGEQRLVVVHHPEIRQMGQGVQGSIRRGAIGQGGRREIREVEIRAGLAGILDEGPQIDHPFALFDQLLLHVERDRNHVEAWPPGAELHRHFRTLLLFGDLFRPDLDAGQVLELLLARLHDIGGWVLAEIHFDLRTFGLLPVELALRVGALNDRGGGKQAGTGGEQVAAADHGLAPCGVLLGA